MYAAAMHFIYFRNRPAKAGFFVSVIEQANWSRVIGFLHREALANRTNK